MVAEKRKNVGQPVATTLGVTAIKPVERHGWEAVKFLLYDKDTGAILTRTPKSWFLIFIFYAIFYSCLAGFWYGLLQVFFIFLPATQPKYILQESIIGVTPGVGMIPNQPDVSIDSSMLYLKVDAKGESPSHDFETAHNIDWAKRYEKFLQKYDNKTDTRACTQADAGQFGHPACQFDLAPLGDCGKFPYGYQLEDGKQQIEPCVLLKINRIFGWIPEPYTDEDIDTSEDPIPPKVKDLIQKDRNQVYLDCVGENPADREAVEGQLKYFPQSQGIPFQYYPYNHAHRNYHNPVVAVKFGAGIPRGQLIHIECKLWAKGVKHSSKDRVGQVHFELFLAAKYPSGK
jgi:sodium/potassium-transporting ATPase subunit beta